MFDKEYLVTLRMKVKVELYLKKIEWLVSGDFPLGPHHHHHHATAPHMTCSDAVGSISVYTHRVHQQI